jgi:hypothetical protein
VSTAADDRVGSTLTGWQVSTTEERCHMQGKLGLAAGFAAGYVLGSKAGRQRYEEIVAQARKLADNQTVQSTAGVLQAQATDLVSKAKQSDLVTKAKQTVSRGKAGDSTPSYSTAGTTAGAAGGAAVGSGTDLFEPVGSTDPLGTTTSSTDLFEPVSGTDPLATGADPLAGDPLGTTTTGSTDYFETSTDADPLNPNNPSGTNGSNR